MPKDNQALTPTLIPVGRFGKITNVNSSWNMTRASSAVRSVAVCIR
ncbi:MULTISPECIES: hypothetical protein [unclassified Burkholderia]|nr:MULTISPECIES: hypothetical protein [unclassified Burkholderia]